MGPAVNRGKVILKNWDERQKELESSFGEDGDLFRSLMSEKYIHMRSGLARLLIAPSIDEKIYAGIIRAMMKKNAQRILPPSASTENRGMEGTLPDYTTAYQIF